LSCESNSRYVNILLFYYILLALSLVGHTFGMFNNILEIDAMQYASMSREILRNENFIFLFDNGKPYLDKPPLIFWVTSLIFKVFGASNFTYRLPSFLFSIMTIYSTYKFANIFYSKRVSIGSVLILSSCITWTIINGDVRTDIYMIGPMMLGVWKIIDYFEFRNLSSLIFGAISIAFAMMGKGPLGLVIPVLIIFANLTYKKEINKVLDKEIFLGLTFFSITLVPMSIGLYKQFGLNGLEFFYWTQSFGRITGESSWSNNTGPLYLFNVFLYSFLPWTFLFLEAFITKTKQIFRNENPVEIVSYFGFIIPLIILSLSNYKLPHYIYCVMPFASVLTAVRVDSFLESVKFKKIYLSQLFLIITLIVIISIVTFFINIKFHTVLVFSFIALIGLVVGYFKIKNNFYQFFMLSIVGSLVLSLNINIGIFLPILSFQSESEAAIFIKKRSGEGSDVILYKQNEGAKSRSFNFYLNTNTQYIDTIENLNKVLKKNNSYIFTNEAGYQEIIQNFKEVHLLKNFEHYRISKVTTKFINSGTRNSTLQKKYLLQVRKV